MLAGVCAALVGIVFGLPSLRIKGFYLAVATLAAQFFIVWLLTKVGWFSNYSASGVITAQTIEILGYTFDTPGAKYLLVLAIVAVLALAAKNMVRSTVGPRVDGGARHGRRGGGDRHPAHAHQAARLRRQLVLLRRGGRAVRLRVPRAPCEPEGFNLDLSFRILFMVIIGGVGSILGSFLGAAFITLLPIFLERAVAAHRRTRFGLQLPPGTISNLRADRVRRADHLLPGRRAARARAAVADRQGEAAAVAVPLLTARAIDKRCDDWSRGTDD